MNFFDYSDTDFQPPERIREIQAQLFGEHIRYCAAHSPYYREVLAAAGVDAATVTLDDIGSLPLTGKEQLAAQNQAFRAVAPERIVDIVLSSGTTGIPTRIEYTERDLQRLAYNEHLSFAGTGIGATDIILLTCTMDRCFVAGLAYFLGARSLGAAAVRNGHCNMDGHMALIVRTQPTAIIGVPSFLRKLGVFLRAAGMDPRATAVRRLVCIGEPLRDVDFRALPVARALAELWDADAFSTYASSEIVTSFCECSACCGGHLHPELAVAEILDENGCPAPDGTIGEVVVTPLAVEGMPLIRFRTGDLSCMTREPCACGRNALRLGPIVARRKQMIKLKGTTLYPQAITLALETVPQVVEHYIEVTAADALSDAVTVHVCLSDASLAAAAISDRLQAHLRVKPTVVIESEARIREQVFSPRSRKPVRFIDRRES